ncbi:hypothetical protein [Ancylomarina longa]|uniref:VWA domain-containing protein n=1 Tax=Ancylomarina longa TaxID=2487017 RepID=A0A434AZ77_9BACT|nr:hypothetical protein [Ancylomarina longa]RUT79900.1 hypothetical protein DLK05_00670 [Ancylomarina longa]
MNISFVSGHSYWWILLFILIAFGIVYWQYFFKNRLKNELSKLQLLVLAGLRFLAILLMFLLLLQPVIKHKSYISHKPILIFAQDNSKSILYHRDTSFYKNVYPHRIDSLLQEMNSRYEIHKIEFGSRVQPWSKLNYNATTTNYSQLIEFLKDNYSSLPDVQVLLASDGIYNSGGNPRYQLADLDFPIHTIQLGDTSRMVDVLISSIKSNQIGFVNTNQAVRVGIKALNLKGEKFSITIKNRGKVLIRDEVRTDQNTFYLEKEYLVKSDKKGLQQFNVLIQSKVKEYSLKNNKADFVVDVLDTKRNIAICYDQYHPDLAALRSAIEENKNFSTQLVDVSKETPVLKDVNLLVFYQIPSLNNSDKNLIQKLLLKNIPCLFIIGVKSDISYLNQAKLGVHLIDYKRNFQQSLYLQNEKFSLFELGDAQVKSFESLPPLLSPMADYQFQSEYHILAYQKIKNIQTKIPLIAFTNSGNEKIAWIFGEGFWRWKLYSYRLNYSHDYFNSLINKIVQYLAIDSNRDRLIIRHSNDYFEGEDINIEAELYNKSYQLNNKSNLVLVLKNKDDKTFQYQFQKSHLAYKLSIPFLDAGRYKYQVLADDESNLKQQGEFIVRNNNTESKNLQVDKALLQQISKGTNGKYFEGNELDKVFDFFMKIENPKPILSEKISLGKIIDLLFILIFIIILMILEWFLKKYWLGF